MHIGLYIVLSLCKRGNAISLLRTGLRKEARHSSSALRVVAWRRATFECKGARPAAASHDARSGDGVVNVQPYQTTWYAG
jgi:hypothetical protein